MTNLQIQSGGNYWSSTNSTNNNAMSLVLGSSTTSCRAYGRKYGANIRPVREPEPQYVDLGLPSGTLWADRNVGANVPEDSGLYFSWGNTSGHTIDEGYDFDLNNYRLTEGFTISNTLYQGQDAAFVNMGEDWEMPKNSQLIELVNYTDHEYTRFNGVYGWKFINRNDSSKYIFLPHCGYFPTSVLYPTLTYYISKTRANSPANNPKCYVMYVKATEVVAGETSNNQVNSYFGMNIRAIYSPKSSYGYVDLDLPSGLLWSTKNIGAVREEDEGLCFAWGERIGYANVAARNEALGRDDGFSRNAYDSVIGNPITDLELGIENDAANIYLGDGWRTPSYNDFLELIRYTTFEVVTVNNISCTKFTGRNGKYFIIPHYGKAFENHDSTSNNNSYVSFQLMSRTAAGASQYYRIYTFSVVGSSPTINTAPNSDISERYHGYHIRPVFRRTKKVDLGLPSGLLWSETNLCSNQAEDCGLYFAWGETTGYENPSARNSALGRSDGFSSDAYIATGGNEISGTTLSLENDAANVILGGNWKIPTENDFKELNQNTTKEEVVVDNVNCTKFTATNGNSIIIPHYYVAALNSEAAVNHSYAKFMLSSRNLSGSYVVGFGNYDNHISVGTYFNTVELKRYSGYQIRPVQQGHVAVDLGLPSGTLWADRNLGATAPEDAGLYFAWGETEGYKDAADRNAKLTAETGTSYTGGFDTTSYNRTDGVSGISGNLSSSNDAATVMLGGDWRMPTKDEIKELSQYTNYSQETINGIVCCKFVNKTDSTKFIIIPLGGYIYQQNFYSVSSTIELWSSTYPHPQAYSYDGDFTGDAPNRGTYCGLLIRPVQ